MATLETQYKNYLRDNPDSKFTFDEWKEWWGKTLVTALRPVIEPRKADIFQEIDRICVRGCHDFILEKGIMTPITPQQYYTAGYKKALKDLGHE
jgi:hypothetical protein